MNATILAAGEDLIESVARCIEESAADPADATVIFPGKRPAHFLRQRLAQIRAAAFAPPRILSMDELVDEIFETREARGGGIRPRLEAIDAVALLYDIQISASRPLGGAAFMTLDSFFPLGMKIWNDLEELHIECVPARKVAEVQTLVEEEVPPRSRERLRTLAYFYEEFYRVVDERGFSTRSSRYRLAAEEAEQRDMPRSGPIVLAGFYALTNAERALFLSLAAWPRARMIFQDGPGLRERLKGLAVPGAASAGQEKPRRPDTRFSSSPDAHGQVFALNAALSAPDNQTLIVLPKPDTLFPLLRHCLSRFDPESYNVSLPYPLQRTPLHGFLNDLMELVGSMDGERVYLPAYITFALHPYVKNIRLEASAEATRVLFHTLEERLAKERTRRFSTLEEIESNEDLFIEAARRIGGDDQELLARALRAHLADIHQRTVAGFRSFRSVRDFAERCIQLISWVHDESTAHDHPYFTPFSEAFVRSLETIARSLLADKSFDDTGSYFALLRRYLQTCYLPFPGTPLHGMQVLGALETRNLRFDRVFVLDANEGSFPATIAENTLLPFPVRAALGLSTHRDQEDIAAYHFALLAAGARELHLFSLTSGENQRSRFVERLLWERQKAESVIDESGLVRPIQYRVTLSTALPAAVPKTPQIVEWLRARKYSATTLDAYLQCPLKFYYDTVLNLGQREETTGEIEAVDIGTFVHEVLFRYFSSRTGRPLSPEDADPAGMAALVEVLFEQRFGSAETGANRLLRDQIRRHLADFAGAYLRGLVARHRVVIQAVEHGIAAAWQGFSLKGRLDAVEDRDGTSCLVDYKTSAHRANYALRLPKLVVEDRATWSAAIPTLQLPFYVLLHAAETGRDPVDVQAMFLLLGRTEMNEGIEVSLFDDPAAAAEAWPRLEKVILGLLAEIISPDTPFTPALDLKRACPRCDFTGICGTGWLHRG
ncbi:MAG: PD-(D/E)XK nuclease family protein [Spirochaetia bacterium]